jgi:hypothetical protein
MNKNRSEDYIEHANRATALFKESLATHEAEITGSISTDDARDEIIRLNCKAIDESEKALSPDESGTPPIQRVLTSALPLP